MKSVASQCDSIRESLLNPNHFGCCQGRLPAAGGRRLPEPAVRENEDARGRGGSCGAALLGPRMLNDAEFGDRKRFLLPANTGVCSVGASSTSEPVNLNEAPLRGIY